MDLYPDQEKWNNEEIACLGFERATVYVKGQPPEEAKQRTNDDDVPQWDISCSLKDGRQTTNFKVRIASLTAPAIDGISRIHFGGFRATTYPDGNRNAVSFSADTFGLGDAPSAKRGQSVPSPAEGRKAA